MNASELTFLSIVDLAALIARKEISPVEIARAFLERIKNFDRLLNAYVTVSAEAVMEAAGTAERELMNGAYRGPWHGIPIAVKDNLATKGLRTTCGSKVLGDWVPDFDAGVVERLKERGALIIGKTNMDEWARGGATINARFGATSNPWNADYTPGGSSGGSAAAVAVGLCAGALGTDSGGSIRNPASSCGVVGLKPTRRRVSRYGQLGALWTLDHVGTITRSVRDAAVMLKAIAGYDARDGVSSRTPAADYDSDLAAGAAGVRVGLPREPFYPYVSREVTEAFNEALRTLDRLGTTIVEVSLPGAKAEHVSPVHATFSRTESAAAMRDYVKGNVNDFGVGIRRAIELGELVTAVDYIKAHERRRAVMAEFDEVLKSVDVIATPTLCIAGETRAEAGDEHINIDGRMLDRQPAIKSYTSIFNVTGLPAISVPCGFSTSGLPIGLQIAGRPFDEATVLKVAYSYEQATGWRLRRPPCC